ncbi:protein kinase family protein [Prescottella subtropica]|uniref:protein kinase family protein n=1 Tax=Prescottella subtropica TaxID=2545757 RepID=UPI0010F7D85A|nr:protein kinase family protein [Prescottella subtropica]
MTTTTAGFTAVESATAPADLFGPPATDSAARRAARREFHRLSMLVHPDRVAPADAARAAAAFATVTELYRSWCGEPVAAVTLTGTAGTYTLGGRHACGSVADLFRATDTDGTPVTVKIPRAVASNVLLDAERAALTDIAASAERGHDWLRAYFPTLVDRVTHVDAASGARRSVNVLDALADGFVTLADVRAAHPDGIDPRDWAWMHRRLLRAVAAAHRAGWVHTAITADNVLIHPDRHGVVLAGWSFATRPGDTPAARIGSQRQFYPPDTAATPAWDVYMTHALMRHMLAGRAPTAMRRFVSGCMQDAPRRRPDAADLLTEFDDLLDRLYGRRRFRPFAFRTSKGQ